MIFLSWINLSYEDNLISRIHAQVNASLSSTWWNWNAMRAVDLNENTNPGTCQCCAGAWAKNSWWRLDLGNVYPIKEIIFIGRSDNHDQQTTRFLIYRIAGSTKELIYTNRARRGNRFNIPLNPPVTLQILQIDHKTEALTICELKLIESEYCPSGSFGDHCEKRCHCIDKMPCNRTNGICSSEGCEPGWSGHACDEDINLIKRIHSEVTVSMSDPYSEGSDAWSADRAVDLIEDSRPYICHCCSSTTQSHSFWRLDLGHIYPIKEIIVLGRTDGGERQSRYFDVYYSNTEDISNMTLIWQHTSRNGSMFIKTLNNTILTRYVEVTSTNPNEDVLTICEFKLIEGDCPLGRFDTHCSSFCHCNDNLSCNKQNGSCQQPGCKPGWRGTACDSECKVGWFGQNCSSHCHCRANNECNHITGECEDGLCSPGWMGLNCSIECDKGRFGQNCTHKCRCRETEACDPIDGRCPSALCSEGWRGDNCSIECRFGTFGLDCSSVCHCASGEDCHHINGSCPEDACETGWKGSNCSIAIESSIGPERNSSAAVFVGAGCGVAGAIIVAAVIFIYRRQRRQKASNDPVDTASVEKYKSDAKQPTMLLNEKENAGAHLDNSIKKTTATVQEHEYYDFDKGRNIPVRDIWDYVLTTSNKSEKLNQEFQELPQGLIHECTEATKPENTKKNKYKRMYAYDHSRVVLHRDDTSVSTYINACYIDGYRSEKSFIASQGPTTDMVGDFWEMVLQENSLLIVMLTNVIEQGTRKCIQYWASEKDDELRFGDISVMTVGISAFPDYAFRELDVTKTGCCSRRITHAHFTAWPDKDVPDSAWHLVNFWRTIRSMSAKSKGPVVVHCSAGIGRTGTFIALDILHAQAKAEGYIQPFDTVKNMREQRVNMVQTKAQYTFLHEAVAESLYVRTKSIKSNEFQAHYESLLRIDTPGHKSGLEQQFELILDSQGKDDNEYYNFTPRRESDEYRPKGTSEANATNTCLPEICYIQNYSKKDNIILARLLNSDDAKRLLRLIDEHNITTIISLQDHDTVKDMFGVNVHDVKKRKIEMKLVETKQEKFFQERTFAWKQSISGEKVRRVRQFLYDASENSFATPSETQPVISVLNAVQKWQADLCDTQCVLLTYESAFDSAGIMCLLFIEFERIREKDEGNLLATVKHMKQRHAGLIPKYEHYKFCHSAVLEYIRQSDVYMNV